MGLDFEIGITVGAIEDAVPSSNLFDSLFVRFIIVGVEFEEVCLIGVWDCSGLATMIPVQAYESVRTSCGLSINITPVSWRFSCKPLLFTCTDVSIAV